MRDGPVLSDGELDVMRRMAEGDTTREIAAGRGTSPYTVRAQLESVYAKIGARSRTHAVSIGFREGWLT